MNDLEMLKNIQNGGTISAEYLNSFPISAIASGRIIVGPKTFYTDNVNYYDKNGKKLTEKEVKRLLK